MKAPLKSGKVPCSKNSCTCKSLRTLPPKGGQAESKRGIPLSPPSQPSLLDNSLVEESEEISHDHDDHTGKGDEDLLDLVHPLSWALQFCNIKGLSGCLSSSESQAVSICESHLLDQFRGASSTQFWRLKYDPGLANQSIIFFWPLSRSMEGFMT